MTVSASDNEVVEALETVILTLTPAGTHTLKDTVSRTVTIQDDDDADVIVTPVDTETDENLDTGSFTVVLKSEPTGTVTIPVSSSDTGEGTTSTASLDFTPGDWDTAQTVTVTGVNDSVTDGTVAYSIVLGAATAPAGDAYENFDPADVPMNNGDNEPEITLTVSDGIGGEPVSHRDGLLGVGWTTNILRQDDAGVARASGYHRTGVARVPQRLSGFAR